MVISKCKGSWKFQPNYVPKKRRKIARLQASFPGWLSGHFISNTDDSHFILRGFNLNNLGCTPYQKQCLSGLMPLKFISQSQYIPNTVHQRDLDSTDHLGGQKDRSFHDHHGQGGEHATHITSANILLPKASSLSIPTSKIIEKYVSKRRRNVV